MEMQNKNFKIKISESCKNGLRLLPDKKFAPNQVIALTAEEFFSPSVQVSLQKKMATIEERPSDEDIEGKLYRSTYNKTMNVPQIGIKINPNQVFYVSEKNSTNPIIDRLINNKWIISEKEYQLSIKKEEKVDTVKETVKTEKTTRPKITRSKTKQIKQVVEKVKQIKQVVEKVKGIENTPKNMHVHIPDAVRADVEIKKIPKVEGIIDLAENFEEETISFVDKEQSEQRRIKSNLPNNEEVE